MEFLGEEAEDGEGPKREFWTCIAKDINKNFEGAVDRKVPMYVYDVIGLQVTNYICTCVCACACACAYTCTYMCV